MLFRYGISNDVKIQGNDQVYLIGLGRNNVTFDFLASILDDVGVCVLVKCDSSTKYINQAKF